MSDSSIISTDFLSKIPIFERLTTNDLETLTTLWAPRTLKQSEILFRKGDQGSSMFIIEDGIIEIRVPDILKKTEVRVSVMHQGAFFGEISLLDGLPRTATAVAVEETRLLVMRRDDFIAFTLLLFGWMALNSIQLWLRPFDEFPFIFLNLMLSTIAALQAPVIMMSQNRAGKKDRLRAELDYQVNLKSELMLQQLHAKLDEVRAAELQTLQETIQVELSIIRKRLEEFDASAGKKVQ